MSNNATEKPKNVDYFRVPCPLWLCVRRLLPPDKPRPQGGRPAADKRAILNGIWYVFWTGCQWKAVKREWFGVGSSALHQRFQQWLAHQDIVKKWTIPVPNWANILNQLAIRFEDRFPI